MLNEVLKIYENTETTSVDVKANKNNKKSKIWWLYLTNFIKSTFKT